MDTLKNLLDLSLNITLLAVHRTLLHECYLSGKKHNYTKVRITFIVASLLFVYKVFTATSKYDFQLLEI